MSLIKVTSPRVPSGECKRDTSEERHAIMQKANFMITIPPEQGLAMKADLCLPWNKLRLFNNHRWLKSWGANIASERNQRCLLKSQLSELEVEGESVPFVFDLKHGGQELRTAPLAFVTDIKSMIFHLITSCM